MGYGLGLGLGFSVRVRIRVSVSVRFRHTVSSTLPMLEKVTALSRPLAGFASGREKKAKKRGRERYGKGGSAPLLGPLLAKF